MKGWGRRGAAPLLRAAAPCRFGPPSPPLTLPLPPSSARPRPRARAGNHDDPAGGDNLSAVDILSSARLVNYFGKVCVRAREGVLTGFSGGLVGLAGVWWGFWVDIGSLGVWRGWAVMEGFGSRCYRGLDRGLMEGVGVLGYWAVEVLLEEEDSACAPSRAASAAWR